MFTVDCPPNACSVQVKHNFPTSFFQATDQYLKEKLVKTREITHLSIYNVIKNNAIKIHINNNLMFLSYICI